jgi:hypothetical protein
MTWPMARARADTYRPAPTRTCIALITTQERLMMEASGRSSTICNNHIHSTPMTPESPCTRRARQADSSHARPGRLSFVNVQLPGH